MRSILRGLPTNPDARVPSARQSDQRLDDRDPDDLATSKNACRSPPKKMTPRRSLPAQPAPHDRLRRAFCRSPRRPGRTPTRQPPKTTPWAPPGDVTIAPLNRALLALGWWRRHWMSPWRCNQDATAGHPQGARPDALGGACRPCGAAGTP
ncbi:hypothetical protein PtB15_7B750 [Puccinia triticina]|nr:hypothetical protein PtB15_7B750 [Puccinia triticina]